MAFSDSSTLDIHTIVIGEEGEYGRRLVRYLENRLLPPMRVYQFTTIDKFLAYEGTAALYLLEEEFFKQLPEEQKEFFAKRQSLILLTSQEGEDSFCKYHNPEELLRWITENLSKENSPPLREGEVNRQQTKLTLVYSPIYEEKLLEIAKSFMKPGDLYLGAEDLGYMPEGSVSGMNSDMGDLCYYIHLREEGILRLLEDMLIEEGEIRMLPSPDMYFYLRELTEEDYKWFFEKLRRESPYREVFWGAGNGFVSSPDILRCFDCIILVDSKTNARQSCFCNRLEKIMNIEESESGVWKRVCREEVLDGAVR